MPIYKNKLVNLILEKRMEKFKVGDKVKLKSESPVMIINSIDIDGYATCKWFNGNEYQEEVFHIDTLVLFNKMV